MPDPRPIALVTGGSSGMGRAITAELASTHRVLAIGRDAARLDAVARETGAEAWRLDLVADGDELAARVAALPRLDALIHAAAAADHRSVADAGAHEWQTQFATNVTAPALLTRAALPLLRTAHGTVVFIGSGASTRPVPGSAVYSASKHALKAVADVLRIDEEPHRVRVVTVSPGQTDTPLLRRDIAPERYTPERYIRPESVAGVVRFAVDAPADVHLTDIAVRPRQEIARI